MKFKKIAALALAGTMIASLAACGSTSTTSSSSSSTASTSTASPASEATTSVSEAAESVGEAAATSAVSSTDGASLTASDLNEQLKIPDLEDGAGKGLSIGFSPYTLTNEYFTAVLNGVKKACDKLGAKLTYFDPQNDPTKQASQIDDMIASGIKALIYIPYDSEGAATVLNTCKEKGVKVINIDNVVTDADSDKVDGIIASDNEQLGYLSGQWVAKNKPDGANILIVHLQTAESCVVNVDGFWKGIKENASDPKKYKEVQVVEGKGDTNESFNVVTDALQAHDNIDTIYCINDTSALGAVQAVEEAGKEGKIDILGKDGAPIGKKAISEGKMVQSSAQRPTYMGYAGVEEAVALLKGQKIQHNVAIPSYSITQDNIKNFDISAWDSLD